MKESLKKLIDLNDQLKDFGLGELLENGLTKICVVALQSEGKSSVLESIIGHDILPKGEGICTRAPIELRLHRIPDGMRTYCIFQKYKDLAYIDIPSIRDKISSVQNELAGPDKEVSKKPVILDFYSSACPDLTLVDLPGITKNPVAGQT